MVGCGGGHTSKGALLAACVVFLPEHNDVYGGMVCYGCATHLAYS